MLVSQGIPGRVGDRGIKGDKVNMGWIIIDFRSYHTLVGQSFLSLLQGDPGTKGDKGHSGDPGMPGNPGVPGRKGHTGMMGMTGPQGEIGAPGAQGPVGNPGIPGQRVDHILDFEAIWVCVFIFEFRVVTPLVSGGVGITGGDETAHPGRAGQAVRR